MIWYFDLENVQDEKGWYLRIPKVWLLDYTPQMITQISAESFFDLDCAYLKYPLDGNLFEETLCRDPYIETDSWNSKFMTGLFMKTIVLSAINGKSNPTKNQYRPKDLGSFDGR